MLLSVEIKHTNPTTLEGPDFYEVITDIDDEILGFRRISKEECFFVSDFVEVSMASKLTGHRIQDLCVNRLPDKRCTCGNKFINDPYDHYLWCDLVKEE